MRLCRFKRDDQVGVAFFADTTITPLRGAAKAFRDSGASLEIDDGNNLLAYLPGGASNEAAEMLSRWVADHPDAAPSLAIGEASLLVPVPRPNKLFLLAGNYAKHIEEGGAIAAERAETFPYVFMKPPSTTLTEPNRPVVLPKVSPHHIDWELELAVVIGKECKHVPEAEALKYVAGYTVVNDISNRRFRPNPDRKPRDKDSFFDWLHGKWADSFCPCGPCVTSSSAIADPQKLDLKLKLNGEVKQDSSTAAQIFPVAAVIEFISSFVTLEPGDIISTGTPAGVGNTTGTYLKRGDVLEATISGIGTLRSPVVEEE